MTHANISNISKQPEKMVTQSTTSIETRYHYLDNIRALAMFLGVVFHAALAYSPFFHNFWFSAGNESAASIDMVVFFTHLFRMPLFFLVSGFFAIMLLQKRGITGFLKNRAMRILLPFIIFFPLLGAAIFIVIGWALENVENLSPMLQFIKSMQENPDAPTPPLSTMHLWFLFNLFLFALTTAALYKLDFFQSKIVLKIFSAKFIVFVLPLLMIPAMFTQPTPHPAAEKFHPELWSFGFYGLFFLTAKLRNSPFGLLSTFALTGFMGYTLGPIIGTFAGAGAMPVVMNALGLTAFVFFGLSAYALTTRKDFNFLGGFLTAGFFVLIGAMVLGMFTQIAGLHLMISAGFVLFSSAAILYETGNIINGGERNYVMATISLYVSIYNIFISLLSILGMGGDD